jgi:hypothetical protein
MAPMPRPLKQTLWFVGLWAAGVATVAVVAGVLRLVIGAAGG